MSDEHYLELCDNLVHFENASSVNNVFFDEANKQVFAVRSGGATGVVVKGPDDKSSVAFRMEDKGEVKCIKFSIGNKILAVQRTSKSVDFINFIPDYPHTEFTHECKMKNANLLGFCWTNWNEIVFVSDQGLEFYQVFPDKRVVKLLKSHSFNVNWYQYCPEAAVVLLSTTVQANVLQPFAFRSGSVSKMSKFEIELPVVPKPAKLSLSERDVAVATVYGQLYVMYLKHHSRSANSPGAEVVLYHLAREGACKKTHVLKLNTTGKFALNIVDNLVVVHHQSSQTSLIFDIKLKESDGAVSTHRPVLPARSIRPRPVPLAGPAAVSSQIPVPCQLYSSSWSVFQPDIIISASEGYLWYLRVKLGPTVDMLQDKSKLMDFLLRRNDCKTVVLSVCSQLVEGEQRGSLPVVAGVFDKLNQVYKDFLEAEQSYTAVVEAAVARGGAAAAATHKRPVRSQAVIDQSDMYTHVLSAFTERKGACHKSTVAVLMEYIRSLNRFQINVQHYLYELVIKTLVQHNLFYVLHQFLQYHVLTDSKPLACLLLSLESTYPPAHQLSLDMLKRLSTANDEIVEVLLSKRRVLAALRFIRSVGAHDNASARKFLDAARQTGDDMLFFTVFRSFQQRNLRLRGNPAFNPGEHCEEHALHFTRLFGEQALMKAATA
ncbi:regulator of MON1-CCZ1 complex [Corythoichthys intestinalis]|uniref:regulator of MON1-CCZ1 complex n=1 Tax=Corythoichthys intestinalis TaxID=161448 RepID=UPI0025A5377B|nr:regulator of MON1-CCZ1 complex [Corythoichthys intestinalis]XP_061810140.1 regulator of MON1-CCZ1 complex-like [Nerophis lumbriciformis]